MLDIYVRRAIDPPMEWIAKKIDDTGVTANQLTWLGFIAGMLAAICVSQGGFLWAFMLITVNRLCDGLDGCVARIRGGTDLGGFLDICLDMIFYSSIPFAFAFYQDSNALAAAFLIYSFVGTGGSFLAFAIISAKRGKKTDDLNKKSFFYSVGLIEGTETAAYLWYLCLMPETFALSAWVFGGLCWVTTGLRVGTAMAIFRENQVV